MADDPKTKVGRAKMLRRAQQARRDVNNSDPKKHAHEVKEWSHCIDQIKTQQRRAGD